MRERLPGSHSNVVRARGASAGLGASEVVMLHSPTKTSSGSNGFCKVASVIAVLASRVRARQGLGLPGSARISPVVVVATHATRRGTRSPATHAVVIRRQAGRGADGCRAVDRLGGMGAGRSVAAEEAAALPLSGAQAVAGSGGSAGDPVRAAHGDRLAASAAGARLRLWLDLLPAHGRVAAGGRMGAAARAAAGGAACRR